MLQFIVIFLAILIFICFFALIYGMYLKLTKNRNTMENNNNLYSLKLSENEKIIDIETINEKNVLFKISDSKNTYAIIYNIKKNSVESIIKK